MHTDELRAELADLANEVEPFANDVARIRRRVARRRTAGGATAAIVAVALIVVVVSVTGSTPSRINVASFTKAVPLAQLPRLDAAVVLPSGSTAADATRVQGLLDGSRAVEKYAAIPLRTLAVALSLTKDAGATQLHARLCADPSTRSFAVEVARPLSADVARLTATIGANASVQSFVAGAPDAEIFMHVKASDAQVLAVRADLGHEPDVTKVTFLDHQAAYGVFKKLFADQPVLIQDETPADLPESFRIEVRAGEPIDALVNRIEHLPGVAQVITPGLDLRPLTQFSAGLLAHACDAQP